LTLINKNQNQGATPLSSASQEGHVDTITLLLGAEGIEINQPANNGATALVVAKYNKYTEIVQLLTAAGATKQTCIQ